MLHERGTGAEDEEQFRLGWCGRREGLEEVVEGVVDELADAGVVGVRDLFRTAPDERR
ncbi:hypothetical protein [Streptomyces sp. SAS_260]|uniref:hypothetical protein n=1 Tax=Streptomyces sp. SAS_260 TaxID=3412751 RepID=UPI00403D0E70